MRHAILAGLAAALAIAGQAGAQPTTSRTEPVRRLTIDGTFRACSVSFTAFGAGPNGAPDRLEIARGAFLFTHLQGDPFGLAVRLSGARPGRESGPSGFAAPLAITIVRDGRALGGATPTIPSPSPGEPNYSLVAFSLNDPDIRDLLVELGRSGHITIGFAMRDVDPFRTVDLDLAGGLDSGAQAAWRRCVADLLQGEPSGDARAPGRRAAP